MSYIIEPMPLITFLEESKLKLPRFQRKPTWDKKQNFELVISVFQEYPVGVVIVNQEQKVSWLLDGRQRRAALSTMRDNPVALYEWARSYIGFSKNADELDVTNAYWDKLERYLQTEEVANDSESDEMLGYGGEETGLSSNEENSFDSVKQRQGLQTLLDVILMVHQNKPSASKWEQTFDFRKHFNRLKYAPVKNNNKIDPRLLRRFILELIRAIEQENEGDRTQEFFIDYYLQNFDVLDKNKFENDVAIKWTSILNSIDVIDRSEKVFADARIGLIRLTNATPLDAQNIFSRINRGGTQLKAEELLSAKPYWDKVVGSVDRVITDKVALMYKRMDIPTPDSVVRWDIAATLVSRIQDQELIFDSYMDTKEKCEVSMDEISLGFKLLSSIYQQGMSNKHVIELERNESINWEYDIDNLVQELNTVCHILLADKFFKCYQSWKMPMVKILGNAIALEFITIMWLDWKEKGCPTSVSADTKALQRDAKILFDKLIFEYATKTWRGSGDSKMSNDIKNWKDRINPVDKADWQEFIRDACSGVYKGQETTVKLLKPILYYYYVITDCTPLNQVGVSFDADHIIPKEIFRDNVMIRQSFRDSLVNLALLPRKENIAKSSKRLNEIADTWLKRNITIYTGIPESDFACYSDVTNFEKLKESRARLFLTAFDSNRSASLTN